MNVEAACGFSSPAQDYQISEIDLNGQLMPNRVEPFLIRARGHSKIRAGIFDGDELIVDRSSCPECGRATVAEVGADMTAKRLVVGADGAELSSENRHQANFVVTELSELHIRGVVTTRSLHRVLRA